MSGQKNKSHFTLKSEMSIKSRQFNMAWKGSKKVNAMQKRLYTLILCRVVHNSPFRYNLIGVSADYKGIHVSTTSLINI